MAYPQQLQDLIKDVKSRLNESANSNAARLSSGADNTATIESDATITQYINEALADIARTCYPIFEGMVTTTGNRIIPFKSLTPATSGYQLWAARTVVFNGITLTHCSLSTLSQWYPSYLSDGFGTPRYWYEIGTDSVGIYPVPSSPATLNVFGLAIPKFLSSSSDVPAIIPDLEKLLVFYAAAQVALKNSENTELAPKAQIWMTEYEQGKADLLKRLWQQDPLLANAHYPAVAQAVPTA